MVPTVRVALARCQGDRQAQLLERIQRLSEAS
jgi:hypothetical protein